MVILALMLTVTVVLSGCSKDKEQSPRDVLQSSTMKSSEMTSYNFKGDLKIEDFNFPEEDMSASEAAAMIGMLKSAELSWTGGYRADPMLMEINLQLALKGDLAITFNVPIVMTEKKIWVKVPNIPMLPIPETMVGKFIELDLEELAEQAGQSIPSTDIAKSQKLINDVTEIVFKHIEEEKYLKTVKASEAGVPSDVEVAKVVQFHMDQSQIEPFINTVVEKIAPEIIELLSSNQEYRDLFQLKQEDLDEAKKALGEVKEGEISEGLEQMKKELKSLNIKSNIGIDKKNYPVYSDATISASIESEELTGSFGIKVVSQMSNVNGEVKFEVGEPKAEEIVTMDQLQEELGGMFGGFEMDSF